MPQAFDEITFVEDDKAVTFRTGDTTWKCDLGSYDVSKSGSSAAR